MGGGLAMVKLLAKLLFFSTVFFSFTETALALLGQTNSDLAILEDTLRSRIEDEKDFKKSVFPLLLATPLHHWAESKADFAASVTKVLTDVGTEADAVIACTDCDTWRLNVASNNQLQINNGELTLTELSYLRKMPKYGEARAVAMVRETPSGVEMKVISIEDGRILFYTLADSSKSLDAQTPYLNYARERDRRLNGEALSYVFVNIGVYPQGLFQLEFVEQWGDRNQHISGIGLSLVNPVFSIGAVYHYMFPNIKRMHATGALYYPLQNALADAAGQNENLADSFVVQAMIQYAFANSYAVFAAVSSEGSLSAGFSFYNPLFLPFLL
jgi:hypothetical protein